MRPLLLACAPLLIGAQFLQANLTGVVRDGETRRPLADATVLLPELDRAATTDAQGRYEIRQVSAGPHHILVRFIGYEPRTLHALLPRGGDLEINITLRPRPVRLGAVDVRAPVAMRGVEGGATSFPDREVSNAAVANHPLLAEPDALHALGGGEVALKPETPGGAHIRGGSTDQTAYLLDGVPVFSPYHTAGISTAWNPDALSRVYLTATSPSPAYPHALSGVVEGVTRAAGDRVRMAGSISTTQARLTLDGPLWGRGGGGAGGGEGGGPGGAVFLLSGRTGAHETLARREEPAYLRGGTGDMLGKLEAPLAGGRLRLLGFASANEIDVASETENSGNPNAPRNLFEWQSWSFGSEWWRVRGATDTRLRVWSASGDASAEWSATAGSIVMGGTRRDLGFLAAAERRASGGSVTGAEVRLERTHTAYTIDSDSLGLYTRLDERSPVVAALARHSRPLGARFELDVASILTAFEGDVYAGPRAQLRWEPGERISLSGSYARTQQFAQSLRNAESVVGHIFPVDVLVGAGDTGVPVARGHLGVVAADVRPTAGVRFGAQAYSRTAEGLVLVAPRHGEPFATAGFVVGTGSARGVSVEAAATTARFAMLASYGWQRVRYQYGDSSYIPEHGAAHRVDGGLLFFPTVTTTFRLGVSAAFGRRSTTVPNEIEWESCNLLDQGCEFSGSPHYGAEPIGATRLPAYVRVDVSVRQHWHVGFAGRNATMAVFGTVTNVLGRTNLLTYARDSSTGRAAGIELRPPGLLLVGLDWSY